MANGKGPNYRMVKAADLELRPGGTVKFEGGDYGFGSSFFHVKVEPGQGASLHVHPYPETWIVIRGRVRFTVGGEPIEPGEGNMVVAGKEIPHKFVNIGSGPLEMVCLHPSERIIQEDLEE
jgi:mannose-6-phosphate isomerase-like protein (cupin superfamily)